MAFMWLILTSSISGGLLSPSTQGPKSPHPHSRGEDTSVELWSELVLGDWRGQTRTPCALGRGPAACSGMEAAPRTVKQ